MELLRILTLLYVAVLVIALAASLITILVYLWRIGGVLGQAREALVAVRDHTQPLAGHLEPLHALQGREVEAFEKAGHALRGADERLADSMAPRSATAA